MKEILNKKIADAHDISIKEQRCVKVKQGLYFYKGLKIAQNKDKWYCTNTSGDLLIGPMRTKVDLINQIDVFLSVLYKDTKDNRIEMTDDLMIQHNDEIYNAIYYVCKSMIQDKNLEWNMHYIGDIAEYISQYLEKEGFSVCYPGHDGGGVMCSKSNARCKWCTYK